MIVIFNSYLNIKSTFTGDLNYNINFYIAVGLVIGLILYIIWLFTIFRRVKKNYKSRNFKQKYGSLYQDLDVEFYGSTSVFFHIIMVIRSVSVAFIVI